MQFQVPQFIETENKIIGPLTLTQFFYLAGAGAICFILFYIFKFWLWLIITGILGTISLSFAFIKYHGRPLPVIVMAAIGYFWNPRFYLWKKTEEKIEFPEIKAPPLIKEEGAPAFKNLWLRLTTFNQPISKAEKRPFGLISKEAQRKEKFEVFRKITGEREAARRVDYR